jgi:hypothetical protein
MLAGDEGRASSPGDGLSAGNVLTSLPARVTGGHHRGGEVTSMGGTPFFRVVNSELPTTDADREDHARMQGESNFCAIFAFEGTGPSDPVESRRSLTCVVRPTTMNT